MAACMIFATSTASHAATSKPAQQLRSSSTVARVGVSIHDAMVAAEPRGDGMRRSCQITPAARHQGVRCQAFPNLFTRWQQADQATTAADEELVDLVGTVQVLKEGNFDVAAHMLSELLCQKVQMYLVSTDLQPGGKEPKISPPANLLFNNKDSKDVGSDSWILIKFPKVPKDFGKPGALLVHSEHENEFFLQSLTLEMPFSSTAIHFPCHSWIDHVVHNSNKPRVFFSNQAYLPKTTPEALVKLREEDLVLLRGNGKGERKASDRIYDYDVYNDLGSPDKSADLERPTLGGSSKLPYPRRCRSGRARCKKDEKAEEPVVFDQGYIPRDERFSPYKMGLFLEAGVRCFGQNVLPALRDLLDKGEYFTEFDEVYELYEGELRSIRHEPIFKNPEDGARITFPPPGVVQASKDSWLIDGEFGRQRLAGLNPFCIERLKEFPITSKLDPKEFGPAASSIKAEDLEGYLLEGLSVNEAIQTKRLFILDYHDAIMPYVNKINAGTGKIYASRTIFFLSRFGILLPAVIELSLPPGKNGEKGVTRVFKRPPGDLVDWEWRLAKTHVVTLDGGIHQLVSHWLRTHACVEPFIIATHRQLSTMHPLHVLLSPHFKDTMNINAMARTSLINAHGIIEKSFTPGKYSSELSAVLYKNWRFDEQALPKDLIKRGMAEKDEKEKHGVKLVIDDYPYAKDGLDLWGAIKDWVGDYVGIYYKKNTDVEEDNEVQAWWREISEVGHGDHKGAEWWGEMKVVEELVEAVTTIIWVASGHHSAVNFGQYAYAGFMPNCPTSCTRLIPEEGTKEHEEFLSDPEKFFLSMVSTQGETTLVMATVQLLAQHLMDEEYLGQRKDSQWSSDEEYLGQRKDSQWSSDPRALDALERFSQALVGVDGLVDERNKAGDTLLHRNGPAKLPYTLLAPLPAGHGLSFRGVPNSISI